MKSLTIFQMDKSAIDKDINSIAIGNSTLHNLYENSNILNIPVTGVTNSCYLDNWLKDFDFNIKSDFIFLNDDYAYIDLVNYSSRSYDFFTKTPNIFQVNFAYYIIEDLFNKKTNLNHRFVADTIHGMLYYNDIILMSDLMWDKLSNMIYEIYNDKSLDIIAKKTLKVPPPGFYRFDFCNEEKDYSSIKLLWNHKFSDIKNFKSFYKIFKDLTKADIPVELYITCSLDEYITEIPKEDNILNIHFLGKTTDKDEYENILRETNCTIATSNYESFGISLTESIKYNHVVVGLHTIPYNYRYGETYTIDEANGSKLIQKIFKNRQLIEDNVKYHQDRIKQLPTSSKYINLLSDRMNKVYDEKFNMDNY